MQHVTKYLPLLYYTLKHNYDSSIFLAEEKYLVARNFNTYKRHFFFLICLRNYLLSKKTTIKISKSLLQFRVTTNYINFEAPNNVEKRKEITNKT